MLKHLPVVLILSIPLITPVFADVDIVVDDFESYAGTAAMQTQWVSTNFSPSSTFLFDDTTSGQPYPVSPAPGAVDGTAVLFDGSLSYGGNSVNRWATPFSVVPSATQNVELRVDLGYDNVLNNKKL
jgi:hypothetical protein